MPDDPAMNLIPENFQSWWSHITFSVSQKRSLLSISALVIALSIFLVVRGTSQEIALAYLAPLLTGKLVPNGLAMLSEVRLRTLVR
jgi:hypothetical protein